MNQQLELQDSHNAARLFFDQASRPELRDRPRLCIADGSGGWTELTWGYLADRAERLAAFLIDRGIDAGAKVCVLGNTRAEWGIAALALMSARGSLVPVYPTMTSEQMGHVIGHSDAKALVVENAEQLGRVLGAWSLLAGKVETVVAIESVDGAAAAAAAGLDAGALEGVLFQLGQADELGAAALVDVPDKVQRRIGEIELSDVAYLVYTSGTTGLPKGVPLTHFNVGSSGLDWLQCNGELVREGDVDLLWLPMSHLYGMGEFFLGNQVGFTTYISDPMQALIHLPQIKPHVFMSVPAYWEKIMQLAVAASDDPAAQQAQLMALTGGRLRFCLSGGAGLAREVKDFFYRAGILIIEGYGLTECSPNLTFNHKDDFDFDTVGKPCPSVELKLADDGEILAKGPNVFSGYYKDPEATKATFDEEGWLCTGDLGRFTDRGFLQIIGRKKEILVTSGGKNIPPANIELRFKEEPLIAQIMVYGDGKKYLTALIDINDLVAEELLKAKDPSYEGGAPRSHRLIEEWIAARVEQVNGQLAKFETIKKFWLAPEPLSVEADLLTPTLKLKRAKICQRYRAELEALYEPQ